jgi:hypothetical protein
MQQINLAEVYRNPQAGFDMRVVQNRGEHGEYLEPFHLVEVRLDADSPWVASRDSDNDPTAACFRAGALLKRSTRPLELGG